jgi:hypothetical protein
VTHRDISMLALPTKSNEMPIAPSKIQVSIDVDRFVSRWIKSNMDLIH